MAQKQISRFPLNEKFSGLSGLSRLSGHVPNYDNFQQKTQDGIANKLKWILAAKRLVKNKNMFERMDP